jgi:hypothetical protein
MRRMTVSIAGFIVLVIPLLGQTLRQRRRDIPGDRVEGFPGAVRQSP